VAIDRSSSAGDADSRTAAQELADLLIPLSKSLCTDLGSELTSMAIQIYGGMGYVEETGVAQHYRDIRIGPIYEGTNGIQAADLVGRKLSMRGGGVIIDLLESFEASAVELGKNEKLALFGTNLSDACRNAREATQWLLDLDDPNDALAGSTPFLRLLGTVVCGGFVANSALNAAEKLAADPGASDADFYQAKLVSSIFFGEQILPTANGLLGAVRASAADLFALTPAQLR
jgi:acyl-CoA dehydrogenase